MKIFLLSALIFSSISAFAQTQAQAQITCGQIKDVVSNPPILKVVFKQAYSGTKNGLGDQQKKIKHDLLVTTDNPRDFRRKFEELKLILAILKSNESPVCVSTQAGATKDDVVNNLGTGSSLEKAFADLVGQI